MPNLPFLQNGNRIAWTQKKIEAEKEAIKKELDEITPKTIKNRVQHALACLKVLESQNSSEARLKSFIYAMSILVSHQRKACLPPSQVERLLERAHAILQVEGVKPGDSKLSYLYGEIHQVASLIFRREGRLIRSAWEQQLGTYISKQNLVGGPSFQAFSSAIVSLRLGNPIIAHQLFSEALELGLKGSQKYQALLGSIQCLRLSNEIEKARDAIRSHLKDSSLPDYVRKEIEWEGMCLAICENEGDIAPLIQNVRKGKSHHHPSYIAESFLWTCAHPSKRYLETLPNLDSLAKNKDVQISSFRFLLKSCKILRDCYDYDIPLFVRLKKLGEVIDRSSQIATIDKELLFWLGAARWLARSKAFNFATIILKEYREASLRLSEGKKDDALNLAGDLLKSSWFAVHWEKPKATS